MLRIGFIGLGRMGFNIAYNINKKFETIVWNRTTEKSKQHSIKYGTKYVENITAQEDVKKYGIDTRDDGLMFIVKKAIEFYCSEVKNKTYPSKEYIYPIKKEDLEKLKSSKYWV